MKPNTYHSRIAWFCLVISIGSVMSSRLTPVMAQTLVKSSREVRSRRIEEHRQIRQRTMELTRDLRRLHLTPEQRSEIRKVLTRYNTSAGTRQQEAHSDSPITESETQGCGPTATQPPATDGMNAEVHQILTAEQSEKLNAARHEREERTQRGPDFQVRKKP